MIKYRHLSTLAVAASAALITAGCGQPAANSGTSTNSNAVLTSNSASSNMGGPQSNTGTAGNSPSASQSSNPADSPSAAYRAVHAARKNKDIAALKRLVGKDVLEFLTMLGQAGPKQKHSLDEMLKDLCEQPQAATAEIRNEKINGEKATAEYLDEDGEWRPMDFIKEDGIWKLTLEAPDDASDGPAGDPTKP